MDKKLRKETIFAINTLGRQFSDAAMLMHEAIGLQIGLSGSDHKYLGILMRNGQMTAGEFASLTGLTTGAITGLVDRFEKKKLAKRQADKNDRRKILLVPHTEKIVQLLHGISSDLEAKTQALLLKRTDVERKVIEQYLIAAIALMQETTATLNKRRSNNLKPN